ncbi:MAG: Dabb family protein [Chloroflexota bacterium]
MIRHVIVFNATESHEQVLDMAADAKRILGSIPGVIEVSFGVAVAEQARYRYFFDIALTDEEALAAYRVDPVHRRFADERFRPLAPDRVTTDYRLC